MTNLEYLKTLDAEKFAWEMLIFRPSDSCFDDGDGSAYYALDNTYHDSSWPAIEHTMNWLNSEHQESK